MPASARWGAGFGCARAFGVVRHVVAVGAVRGAIVWSIGVVGGPSGWRDGVPVVFVRVFEVGGEWALPGHVAFSAAGEHEGGVVERGLSGRSHRVGEAGCAAAPGIGPGEADGPPLVGVGLRAARAR